MNTKVISEKEKKLAIEGNIVDIFSSYQGEGGSVRGSCFGRRQIFIRLAGCDLKCDWCDTAHSRDPEFPECKVEKKPGTWEFSTYENPVSPEFVIEQVLNLTTKDLHSISLTGGEPAYQEEFFYQIVKELYNLKIPVFLETNGYFPERIEKITSYISYACVDIKDRSANSVKNSEWEKLVEKEMESIAILNDHSVQVFAKIVVTEQTSLDDIRMYANKLQELAVPVVIQPVTPIREIEPISHQKLFKITEILGEILPTELYGISLQAHKLLSIL
ncbi:MAG: 7-carboxy-7-deazaguanine synthase QueE [Candidatus Heimdallarchaeota archaeon]|nr:7-carboxy-7-deazaguanine synthase QueE [Candidatus Heimdallarchaeota archaeon]MBY8995991.1 7-carboxy-7-deazaguanine synthase QueE [Candidatus Heimdallarchaeota archaeon]